MTALKSCLIQVTIFCLHLHLIQILWDGPYFSQYYVHFLSPHILAIPPPFYAKPSLSLITVFCKKLRYYQQQPAQNKKRNFKKFLSRFNSS